MQHFLNFVRNSDDRTKVESNSENYPLLWITGFTWLLFIAQKNEGHETRHPAASGDKMFSLSKSTFPRSSERVSKWPRICPSACTWLPDGYSQTFRILCVWPFGLLDYGSATLRCRI